MKRTLQLIKPLDEARRRNWRTVKWITCEVTGEMATGEKVWTDTQTGEQYFCMRVLNKYYFYKN